MKKSVMILLAIGLVAAVSLGAYAHGGYGHGGNYGRGGYGGPMMGGNYGSGPMMGGWGQGRGYGYCGGGYGAGQRGWNAPGQRGNAAQLVTEATVKENAEAYIAKYLPGYTIETVEKDEWRPMYIVTLKADNGAEQQMWVRGFDGQIMHVLPSSAE